MNFKYFKQGKEKILKDKKIKDKISVQVMYNYGLICFVNQVLGLD